MPKTELRVEEHFCTEGEPARAAAFRAKLTAYIQSVLRRLAQGAGDGV